MRQNVAPVTSVMSPTFATPCRAPGCAIASMDPYCQKHSNQRVRSSSNDNRPSRRKALHRGGAGYGAAHNRWRKRVLVNDPICRWDLGDGRRCLEPSVIADHVVPVKVLPAERFNLANSQGLCRRHHSTKTAHDRRRIYVTTRADCIEHPGVVKGGAIQ